MANRIFLTIIIFFLTASCEKDDDSLESIIEEDNFYSELFFSEYVEGTSHNKALEIANLTGASIDLESSGYSIKKQSNGSGNWIGEVLLKGDLAHNDVFVIGNLSSTDPGIITNARQTKSGAPLDFNGNDPVGLFKDGVLLDVIGQVDDSGEFAKDTTLRRKKEIIAPTTNFDPEHWEFFEVDNTENLGKY